MSASAATVSFRATVAADLRANTDRRGFRAGASAFVTDPSFSTVFLWRLSARWQARGFRLPGRLLWRLMVATSGCHIHPEAVIGPGLRLPHPVGLTIGKGARLAADVTIYQNVTIGAGYRDGVYPTVEEGATVFPGAVLAGGIVVGARSVIGAGAMVIRDVPPGAVMAGNPARVLRIDEAAPVGISAPCSMP